MNTSSVTAAYQIETNKVLFVNPSIPPISPTLLQEGDVPPFLPLLLLLMVRYLEEGDVPPFLPLLPSLMVRYLQRHGDMPRGPRLDTPGTLHHVMVRGIERRGIFHSEEDRQDLLERIALIFPESGARLYAWSLMPNHFHLLIRSGRNSISQVMKRLLTGYAVCFNRRHRRVGHLFQNRFKSIVVEEETYLLELVRYIHLNPLRAGLVTTLRELGRYRWTGHAALVGKRRYSWQETEYVLSRFGETIGKARRAYRVFVQEGILEGKRPELSGGGLLRSMGGRLGFQVLRKRWEQWQYDERILGSSEFVDQIVKETALQKRGIDLAPEEKEERLQKLIADVADRLAVNAGELIGNSHRRITVQGRALIAYVAATRYGCSSTEIARLLGNSVQSVLRGLSQGEKVFKKLGWTIEDFR